MLEREYSYSFIKTDHFVGFCELLILWACELCADISSGLLEEAEQVKKGGGGSWNKFWFRLEVGTHTQGELGGGLSRVKIL